MDIVAASLYFLSVYLYLFCAKRAWIGTIHGLSYAKRAWIGRIDPRTIHRLLAKRRFELRKAWMNDNPWMTQLNTQGSLLRMNAVLIPVWINWGTASFH